MGVLPHDLGLESMQPLRIRESGDALFVAVDRGL
jgi:hypothetical protein